MESLAHCTCSIVPPYLLAQLAQLPSTTLPKASAAAARTLQHAHDLWQIRGNTQHAAPPSPEGEAPSPEGEPGLPEGEPGLPEGEPGLNRTISDAANQEILPGEVIRSEGEPATGDLAADEAYDGLGNTYALFHEIFGRSSIDGSGGPLDATVHYGEDYDNAFWNGSRMVFGDGDGEVFNRFTLSVTVIGHELTHGFILAETPLQYQGQPGALQESVADVFGVLVEQYLLTQRVEDASWLVGAGLFTDQVQGRALRSVREPGTAYDDDVLGKDPQPATMDSYVETAEDRGGVHINSGIPNRAFYLCAEGLGGFAWERAGRIWYDAVVSGNIPADCTFAEFAQLTLAAAELRYGTGSEELVATAEAWRKTGVLT